MAAKKTIRSANFQVLACDAIGMQMTDNLAQIFFGTEHQNSGDGAPSSVFEQVGIGMTPKTLKLLQVIVTKVVESFEAANGPIPIAPEKVEGITPIVTKGDDQT